MRDPDGVGIRIVVAATGLAVASMLASCAENEPETAVTLSRLAVETAPAPTSSQGATDNTTTAPTTSPTTSPGIAAGLDELADLDDFDDFEVDKETVIGRSLEDRPITVVRRGVEGGAKVLVVGVIHGNEDAGADIVDVLRIAEVPEGVELWLVRSMNPDGQFHQVRHNANGVDLNRNFAHNWGPIAEPGFWEYAGEGPASEPETRAMTALGEAIHPDLVLWYHQDLFRINPASGRDGEIRARYAGLTGLPIVEVSGGTYTGTASQWSRTVADAGGVGFTIELGPSLTPDEVIVHANAVLTIASEL